MLKIGMLAPDFSAIAYLPSEDKIIKVELMNFKGKWLIMSFHPGDFTFTCATDLHEFQKILPSLKENNCEMLGVSIDSIYVHKMWVQHSPSMKDVKFPLLDDSSQTITRDYGALAETGMVADMERITVIINPEGNIEYVEKINPRMGKFPSYILHILLGLKFLYNNNSDNNSLVILPAEWKSAEQDAIILDIPKDIGTI